MTTIYSFDVRSGAYTGAREAGPMDRNRLGALVLAGATETAPPEAPDGSHPRWTGADWEIVPDRRGETWWTDTGIPVTVLDLGDPTTFERPLTKGDPGRSPVLRMATGYALWAALTREQINGLDAKDVGRIQARGSDSIPEDNPVIARLAASAGITPSAWFDAALTPP